MKICLLADIASIHTRRWADATIAAGHDVLIVSPQPFPNNYPKVVIYEKTPTRDLKTRLWRRYLKILNSLYLLIKYFGWRFALRNVKDIFDISRGLGTHPSDISRAQQEIRTFNPDIIHVHNINIPLYQWLIVKDFPKTKTVVTVWGDDIEEQTFRHSHLSRVIKRRILKRADVITAASKRLAKLTLEYAPIKKVEVVPFGVDLDRFKPRVVKIKNPVVIGSVRHLRVTYGIDLMIKAVSLLKNKNWLLIIAGDGNQAPYKKLSRDLGISDKVKFLGEIKYADIPKVLRKIDLFLMPSRWEAFGVAAVEAEASGLPVVGTKVGGIPEVVADKRTGILVPREDFKALAKALDNLIAKPSEITRMSLASPLFVKEHFDWKSNTKDMFKIYECLINGKK